MIKKITLASVATLALLVLPAQAEGMKCQAGKCGASMKDKAKMVSSQDTNDSKIEESNITKKESRSMKCQAGKCGGK